MTMVGGEKSYTQIVTGGQRTVEPVRERIGFGFVVSGLGQGHQGSSGIKHFALAIYSTSQRFNRFIRRLN